MLEKFLLLFAAKKHTDAVTFITVAQSFQLIVVNSNASNFNMKNAVSLGCILVKVIVT